MLGYAIMLGLADGTAVADSERAGLRARILRAERRLERGWRPRGLHPAAQTPAKGLLRRARARYRRLVWEFPILIENRCAKPLISSTGRCRNLHG